MATTGMVDPNKVMEPVAPYASWRPRRFPATAYNFTGPTVGANGVASTFTVALPQDVMLASPVTITPSSGGGGGTFSPTTVRLTDADRFVTFTYTLVGTGAKTISLTNDAGLTNPANIVITIS